MAKMLLQNALPIENIHFAYFFYFVLLKKYTIYKIYNLLIIITINYDNYWYCCLSATGETDVNTVVTTSLEVTIENLEKYTNYSIQVLAFTRKGEGVGNKAIFVRTMENGKNNIVLITRSTYVNIFKRFSSQASCPI